jgi:WD40 repeat protein
MTRAKFGFAFYLGLSAFTAAIDGRADDTKPAATSIVMVPQLVHGSDYHTGAVVSVDGRFVASMHRGSIHVWDVESGALLPTLTAPGMPAATFLSDGIRLRFVSTTLVGGKPQIATTTWDVTTGKTTQRNGPEGLLFPAMVPGGKIALFAESETGAMQVYDIDADKVLRRFGAQPIVKVPPGKANPWAVYSMVVPKNGSVLLLERASGSCELWDVEHGRWRYEVKRKFPTGRTGISANGTRAVYSKLADEKGPSAFDIIDVASGKLLRTITLGRGIVEGIAVSPDGRRAVTAEAPGKIHL